MTTTPKLIITFADDREVAVDLTAADADTTDYDELATRLVPAVRESRGITAEVVNYYVTS